MTPTPPRSPAALVATLAASAFVGCAYAAAALAWAAGYDPRLGPPVIALSGPALVAVRCGLVSGAGVSAALAGLGRWQPALVVLLVLTALAPAWLGPVYAPTDGARWAVLSARAGAPEASLAVQAGAAGGLVALVLLSALTVAKPFRPSSAHGTAAWGAGEVLTEPKAGLVLGRGRGAPPRPGDVASGRPGKQVRASKAPLLRYNGPGHVLTVAPTRAGKGVGAVVPNLLDHPGPVVVTDPKGENLVLTARYRAGVLGHRVVALDPFGLVPDSLFGRVGEGSIERGGLNPLGLIGEGSADAADDAAGIAEMLVVEEGGGGDNSFWAAEAKALLAGLILHVALSESGERRSLLTVRELLTLDADGFETTVEKMKGSADAVVRRAGNRIDQKHDRERSAVVSTAQSHTHFLDSPRMASVLGRSTFDPSALRPGSGGLPGDHVWGEGAFDSGQPLSVYLLLPPDRLDAFSRWLRLVVATSITALAKLGPLAGGAPPAARRALFLLDEFAQLGAMPPVRRAFSLMAGYGVQVWPFLQDLGQLRRLYPKDWESFVANADVLQAFGTTDQFTAEYLSKMAGTATVFDQSTGTGRSRGKHTSRSSNVSARETSRALVTPDELRRLGRADQVLLVRGEQPVLARRIAYYDDSVFGARAGRS